MGGQGSGPRVRFTETKKWCAQCESWLTHDRFGKNKWNKSGLQAYCNECRGKWQSQNSKKPPVRKKLTAYCLSYQRKRLGISQEQAVEMWESQDKKCAICRTPIPFTAHLDHCHSTGKVRGFLCQGCNQGLGNFKDDPTTLKNAIEYLKKNEFEALK